MRPSRLERHLRTSHPALVDKPKAFFETKKDTLKRAKLDDSGSFRQQSSKCDETTDVAQCSQLLMYARFVSGNNIKEEIMFCHPMESFTTAEAIFDVISDFFQENQLSWESLVGVRTDGAPAMHGLRSGFVTKVK
ncbi:protein FAM200C-like [Oratosquilla oratoria]|uniref:protein FAM200C-like n=1 Tax=Oratosquilla oratoria TaxID=337810 RepID=UPI003F771108